MTIFIDMDGVLVDFGGDVRRRWPNKIWEDHFGPDVEQLIAATPKFWEDLPWAHDGKELLEAVMNQPRRTQILSAYADWDQTSKDGKWKWWKRNVPDFPRKNINLVRRSEKQEFALNMLGDPEILVDDYHRNIIEWNNAGGRGIHHISTKHSLARLKELGIQIN